MIEVTATLLGSEATVETVCWLVRHSDRSERLEIPFWQTVFGSSRSVQTLQCRAGLRAGNVQVVGLQGICAGTVAVLEMDGRY